MATGIRITCPACQQQMAVPESVRGKKVRCKGCGGVIAVANAPPAETRVTTPEAQAKKAARLAAEEDEDGARPYGVTEMNIAPRCPHCAYEMEPPDARICLHCGYDMVKRMRNPSIKTYDRTFGDWFAWLAPGVGAVVGFGLLVGLCIYFHYYLPYQMLETKHADALLADRMAAFEDKDMEISGYIFHPGIELWLILFCAWVGVWYCLRFAFKRLVLNYLPPERIKEK